MLPVFGYHDQHGYAEISFHRRPGAGWEPCWRARERLCDRAGAFGPGRIHHCMRAIGMAERALTSCAWAQERVAFGRPLAAQGA